MAYVVLVKTPMRPRLVDEARRKLVFRLQVQLRALEYKQRTGT
jgi:hypothetical protein